MVNSNDRHDELNIKLLRTGDALVNEGIERNDETITQIGNIIIFTSGLIYNQRDLDFFSEICSMMAARSMLSEGGLMDILSDLSMDEIEDLVRIIKSRGKNDDTKNL